MSTQEDRYSIRVELLPENPGESDVVWGDHAKHVLILVPGALRDGAWASEWSTYLRSQYSDPGLSPDDRIVCFALKHDLISAISVITGLGLLSLVKQKRKEIIRIIESNPELTVSIVCHSYGTYLIKEILDFGIPIKLRSLILMSSVIKRDCMEFISKSSELVIADCCQADWLVASLEAFMPWKFKNTSTFMFNGPERNVFDRRNPGGHSSTTNISHCKEYVIPAITKKVCACRFIEPPLNMDDRISKFMRVLFLLFFSFVFILYSIFRQW